jgi:hypothetical protein
MKVLLRIRIHQRCGSIRIQTQRGGLIFKKAYPDPKKRKTLTFSSCNNEKKKLQQRLLKKREHTGIPDSTVASPTSASSANLLAVTKSTGK